ncbi:hypothetical protein BDV96DRAFT_592492 [Lophiotrema nucula]|uniref:Uncharacterized protein n=1 Tax=Lophiotrema nucula TaxID=690887 RepID=A0A6A5YGT7_9PLEO|nr:hypothetical protein BDV96DRAFT_592492 [Lophiotrema nucula]
MSLPPGSSRASIATTATASPPDYASATSATETVVRSAQIPAGSLEALTRFGDAICDDPQSEESVSGLKGAGVRLLRTFAIALLHADGLYITTLIQVIGKELVMITEDSSAQAQYETICNAMDIKIAKIRGGKFIGDTRRFAALIPAAITIILHLDRAELEQVIRTVILRLGKTPTSVDYNWALGLLPKVLSTRNADFDASMVCRDLEELTPETRAAHLAHLSDYELKAVIARKMARRSRDRGAIERAAQVLFEDGENGFHDSAEWEAERYA